MLSLSRQTKASIETPFSPRDKRGPQEDTRLHYAFAPGCALMLYKPQLAAKIHTVLSEIVGEVLLYTDCCHHDVALPDGICIINVCPGCNRRFKAKRAGITTVSLWEILMERDGFAYPDYGGMEMAVHDACPTRTETQVHAAVRTLLERMNIKVLEPAHTKTNQQCCGDSYYPAHPMPVVRQKMQERADEMPAQDVCVYCVDCVKSLHIGGKTPRYLPDLLFGEPTVPPLFDTEPWHAMLAAYRDAH